MRRVKRESDIERQVRHIERQVRHERLWKGVDEVIRVFFSIVLNRNGIAVGEKC